MAQPLAEQRNLYAHGDLEQDFGRRLYLRFNLS